MTDISIIVLTSLPALFGFGVGLAMKRWAHGRLIDAQRDLIQVQGDELTHLYAAEAKRQAQRIAAAKKGRDAQAAAKLAKVAK
jgi:hypothetical protein